MGEKTGFSVTRGRSKTRSSGWTPQGVGRGWQTEERMEESPEAHL